MTVVFTLDQVHKNIIARILTYYTTNDTTLCQNPQPSLSNNLYTRQFEWYSTRFVAKGHAFQLNELQAVHITVSLGLHPKFRSICLLITVSFDGDKLCAALINLSLSISLFRFLTCSTSPRSALPFPNASVVCQEVKLTNPFSFDSHIKSLFFLLSMRIPLTTWGEVTYKEGEEALRLIFKL